MEDKKTYYTEDLVKSAIEDLDERIKWIKENEEEDHYEKIEDCIHEIADNNIPIYTYDLLQYASNNFYLIQENKMCDYSTLPNNVVVYTIQANIYEYLTEKLYNYINTTITIKTQGE